jgi:hypothetical protein
MTLFLTWALACGGNKGDDVGDPKITITAPADGSDVGTCFTLKVKVAHFTLVSPVDEPDPVVGDGHYHVEFGTRYFDCETDTCDIAITNVDPGEVAVAAVLVGNDHAEVLDSDGDPVRDDVTYAFAEDDSGCPSPG